MWSATLGVPRQSWLIVAYYGLQRLVVWLAHGLVSKITVEPNQTKRSASWILSNCLFSQSFTSKWLVCCWCCCCSLEEEVLGIECSISHMQGMCLAALELHPLLQDYCFELLWLILWFIFGFQCHNQCCSRATPGSVLMW